MHRSRQGLFARIWLFTALQEMLLFGALQAGTRTGPVARWLGTERAGPVIESRTLSDLPSGGHRIATVTMGDAGGRSIPSRTPRDSSCC